LLFVHPELEAERVDALGNAKQADEAAAFTLATASEAGRRSFELVQITAFFERLNDAFNAAGRNRAVLPGGWAGLRKVVVELDGFFGAERQNLPVFHQELNTTSSAGDYGFASLQDISCVDRATAAVRANRECVTGDGKDGCDLGHDAYPCLWEGVESLDLTQGAVH
jgi:hypothetical protein